MIGIEIPDSVLKMVSTFLGIDREKALRFIEDFHRTTTSLVDNQNEILETLRYLKARADLEDGKPANYDRLSTIPVLNRKAQ